MELTDGHARLRRPTDGDAEALAAIVRASLDEIGPFMPWATPDYDAERARHWIGNVADGVEDAFTIVDADDRPIGACGLNRVNDHDRIANLGYWLATAATGRGFATRAAGLVARHGFERRGLARIEILMSVENGPSRRVAERVGATHEGVLRHRLLLDGRHHDAHLFSLLSDDPLP